MPALADFLADIDADRIELPAEVAAELRRAGTLRVRVRLEPPSEEPSMLAARGIDALTVDQVVDVQKLEPEIATFVLAGEGIAAGTSLAGRLRSVLAVSEVR